MVGEKKFKSYTKYVVILTVVLSGIFLYNALDLKLNYNFEEFFPANDEESDFFYQHRARFESDNDFILISVENNRSVFDSTFLTKVNQFSSEINDLDLVQYTTDITNQEEVFIYNNGVLNARKYIHLDSLQLKQDSINIFKNKELINSLIAEKANAVAILVRHQDFLSKQNCDALVTQLKDMYLKYNFYNVRFAGRAVGQKFYIDTMTIETSTFVGLSMILVVIFLLLTFKSTWGLLVPQVVIILSLLWILGIMGVMNEPINILLTILPSIMFVVGMSDVIHLVSKYIDLLREGKSKYESIIISLKEIGMATFLTSLTTSIGFFSLMLVNVKPIQRFGLTVGIGVLVAFVLTFSLLPFLFYYTPVPKISKEKKKRNFWENTLKKAFLFTIKRRKALTVSFVLTLAVFGYGISLMVQNNFLMDDLKSTSAIKKDFDHLDETFGGVRPFEIALTLKDSTKSFWDKDVITELDAVENYLKNDYGVNIKNSLVLYTSILNRATHAGKSEYFKIPTSKRKINKLKKLLTRAKNGKLLKSVIDSTNQFSRIGGSIPDWGNIKVTAKNKEFKTFLASLNHQNINYQLTSTAHLLDKNMSYMSGSLVQGLTVATLIVALIMGILFKSFRMVIISIIPNLVPLIVIAGIMGFLHIDLKITTAIVFTISFGIAVDDTIHFLSKFKLELNKGNSKLRALKNTYLSTGRAIILTSLILCSGFLMLLFSNFLGTFYMGFMISLTLLLAVVADLFLLPILLLYFYKPKVKQSNQK